MTRWNPKKYPVESKSGKRIMEGNFWYLHRPTAPYYGAFPMGFEKRVLKYYGGPLVIDVCCGSSKLGHVRIDINREVRPTILADAQYLPLQDGIADLVMVDPPYNVEYAKEYNCKMPSIPKILKEAVRISKPGKFIASLNIIAQFTPEGTRSEFTAGINLGPCHQLRILQIWQKEETLEQWLWKLTDTYSEGEIIC